MRANAVSSKRIEDEREVQVDASVSVKNENGKEWMVKMKKENLEKEEGKRDGR